MDSEAFVEQMRVAFVMFCDEHELSALQGEELSDRIAEGLSFAAEDRREYLPAALGGRE